MWTVHYYSFGQWWVKVSERTGISWSTIATASAVFVSVVSLSLLCCMWAGRRSLRAGCAGAGPQLSLAFGAWLVALSAALFAAESIGHFVYEEAGCVAMTAKEPADFKTSAIHTAWIGGSRRPPCRIRDALP